MMLGNHIESEMTLMESIMSIAHEIVTVVEPINMHACLRDFFLHSILFWIGKWKVLFKER